MSSIHINRKLEGLQHLLEGDIYVVIDNKLKHLHKYFNKPNVKIIEVETSEQTKTLQTIAFVAEKLLECGANRDAFIIGVGGGIVTDMAGFVASIYKRGVRFAFVPTTLLAQVDASIGGKNGVNFNSYKNILGVINQPEWIYICTEVLESLPAKEFKAGVAEVLKTFLLFDKEYYIKTVNYFAELEKYRNQNGTYLQGDALYKEDILQDIIAKCAEYKSGVVERDEFEKGERRLLNLGHTFAHSIEKICTESPEQYEPIMHGEAVAIGMVLAARLSGKYYRRNSIITESMDMGFAEKLAGDLKSVGLPVTIPVDKRGVQIPVKELVEVLKKDKKVVGGSIHFILPRAVGDVKDELIALEDIEELSYDLC